MLIQPAGGFVRQFCHSAFYSFFCFVQDRLFMEFCEFELDEKLLRAVADLEYKKPTKVQESVIPEALDGRDILAESPTGTGKTAAYILPALQHLIDFPSKKLGLARVLVLVPTRELALQVAEQARLLGKYMPGLSAGTLIGGVDHEEQLPVLTGKTDIVIATPGRLIEYLRKEMFDIRAVEILVLDEADRMLDMGFIDNVREISRAAYRRDQTFLCTRYSFLKRCFGTSPWKRPWCLSKQGKGCRIWYQDSTETGSVFHTSGVRWIRKNVWRG